MAAYMKHDLKYLGSLFQFYTETMDEFDNLNLRKARLYIYMFESMGHECTGLMIIDKNDKIYKHSGPYLFKPVDVKNSLIYLIKRNKLDLKIPDFDIFLSPKDIPNADKSGGNFLADLFTSYSRL